MKNDIHKGISHRCSRANAYKLSLVLVFIFVFIQSSLSQNFIAGKQKLIRIKINRIFSYSIPSNLGTGFQWTIIDTSVFKVKDHTSKSNGISAKYTDTEIFKLIGTAKGLYKLRFMLLRPFDKVPDTANAKVIVQKIKIK
jgi:hypothetical protein